MALSIAQCCITQVETFSDAVSLDEDGLLLNVKSIKLLLVLFPDQVNSPSRPATQQTQPGIYTPLSMLPKQPGAQHALNANHSHALR
ncbi:hypothetical protein D3C80_1607470 [compost metagenome]